MNDEWNFGLVSCSIWMLSCSDGCLVNVTRRIIYHCTSIFSLRVSACLTVDIQADRKGRQEKNFSHCYLAEDIQPPNVEAFGTSLSRKRPRFQRCAPKWDTWNALAWVDDFRVIWLIAVEQDGWRFETAWRHHARLRKLSAIELCGLNYASLWY